jgi:serine/threonine protein kinase
MSLLSIGMLLQTLRKPEERVRECRGDEAADNFTELVRYNDYKRYGLVIRKKYHGNLSELLRCESRYLQEISEKYRRNSVTGDHLVRCLKLETQWDLSLHNDKMEILLKWHGLDIQDLMRLLPAEHGNANWRNPTFLLQLMQNALYALRSLHDMGIIHGDIKLDNMVLEVDPGETRVSSWQREIRLRPSTLRLIDFGISLGLLTSYEHLYGIRFFDGEHKSQSLREAHEQLWLNGKDDKAKDIRYTVDLYALGYIFSKKMAKFCPDGHQHLQCLNELCHDLLQIDTCGYIENLARKRISREEREAFYGYWLHRIETELGDDAPKEWTFHVPNDDILHDSDIKEEGDEDSVVRRDEKVKVNQNVKINHAPETVPRPTDEDAWKTAVRSGKVEDYNAYLVGYPFGSHAPQARQKIAQLQAEQAIAEETDAWKTAEDTDTIDAYEAFLAKFPDGLHASQARQKIAQLQAEQAIAEETDAWKTAEDTDTIDAYKAYLAKFPNGTHAEEAEVKLSLLKDEDAWRAAQSENTVAVYGAYYWQNMPNGHYLDQAVKKAWQAATERSSRKTYRQYITFFPQGENASDAEAALKALELAWKRRVATATKASVVAAVVAVAVAMSWDTFMGGSETPSEPPVVPETSSEPPVVPETSSEPPVVPETSSKPPVVPETSSKPPVVPETPQPTPAPVVAELTPWNCNNSKVNNGYMNLTTGDLLLCDRGYERAHPFESNGLAMVEKGAARGWVDAQGREVIAPQDTKTDKFDPANGLALVSKDGKSFFYIDAQGTKVELTPWNCNDSKVNNGYKNLTTGNLLLCDRGYEQAQPFESNGLAMVLKGAAWGWVDAQGREVIAPQYTRAGKFDPASGLARVSKDGKSFFHIDARGTVRSAPAQPGAAQPEGIPPWQPDTTGIPGRRMIQALDAAGGSPAGWEFPADQAIMRLSERRAILLWLKTNASESVKELILNLERKFEDKYEGEDWQNEDVARLFETPEVQNALSKTNRETVLEEYNDEDYLN